MKPKGKFICIGIASLAIPVLILAGLSLLPVLLEEWHLHKLRSGSEEERRSAARELVQLKSRKALPVLLEIFLVVHDRDSDILRYHPGVPGVQDHWSLQALLEIGPPVPSLVEIFRDGSRPKDDRLLALHVLARMGPGAREALPRLVEAMRDSDRDIRRFALTVLGEMREEARAAVPILLEDFEKEVARFEERGLQSRVDGFGYKPSALEALGNMGSTARDSVPLLIRFLKAARAWREKARLSEDDGGHTFGQLAGQVQWAILALGMVGPDAGQAVPLIAGCSRDEEPGIRMAAATALSRIAPIEEGTRSVLNNLTGDVNVHVRAAVQEARKKIGKDR